jgi:hypothetical protein
LFAEAEALVQRTGASIYESALVRERARLAMLIHLPSENAGVSAGQAA